MVFQTILSKLLQCILYQLLGNSFYKASKKMKNCYIHFKSSQQYNQPQQITTNSLPPYPSVSKYLSLQVQIIDSIVCDINGTLLKTPSFFPYFMLVAFEGGSIIRSFLLLLFYPFLIIFDKNVQLRVMIFITFCGLRIKDMSFVGRCVLPKFYLEEMNYQVYQILARAKCKVVITSIPKVMVDNFLKEYLNVDGIVGTELHTFGGYFTGLLSSNGLVSSHLALKQYFGDQFPHLGIGNLLNFDHLFLSSCKEAYVVNPEEEDKNKDGTPSSKMPRDKYPKPLIFHDGRLAFLPTPISTLSMFMWLPFGIPLAILRLLIGACLPQKVSLIIGTLSGFNLRTKGITKINYKSKKQLKSPERESGVLYACTHRTLLDPVMLSICLGKPLTAVTYSLSRLSEFLAPIRTVRLVRDRKNDLKTMEKYLKEGDIVVCPEGTTCREPYLLRFSSLFAELSDELVPVAIEVKVTLFYGNTASGLKWLDPIYFMMNPRPKYYVHVLGKWPKELSCSSGGRSGFEVANTLQRELGLALGFECTTLTRKDKYLMLAGNQGLVSSQPTISCHVSS